MNTEDTTGAKPVSAAEAGWASFVPRLKCPKKFCGALVSCELLECPECGYEFPLVIYTNNVPCSVGQAIKKPARRLNTCLSLLREASTMLDQGFISATMSDIEDRINAELHWPNTDSPTNG